MVSNVENNTLEFKLCLNLGALEKVLWCQWNITQWFIFQMEKAWFYKDSFSKWYGHGKR